MRLLQRFIAPTILVALTAASTCAAASTTKPPKVTTPSAQAPASKPDPTNLKLRLVAASLDTTSKASGDYVPCEFTREQLRDLQFSPYSLKLTGDESEELKQRIIAAAVSDQYKDALTEPATQKFLELIEVQSFNGKTQSQVIQIVLNDLDKADTDRAVNDKRAQAFDDEASKSYINHTNLFAQGLFHAKTSSAEGAPKPVASALTVSAPNLSAQKAALVDTARSGVANLLRPLDVGCSMSILDYNETKRAYGRLVANEYMAVQVVVRNLNRDQEFQLHDVEFAVDIDPSGRHPRFYSGRDKLIVRSFSVAQENFDPRNLTVHSLQALGAMLNAIVPIFGGSYADAIGVFTGGAIPGVDKVWKDSTTDQLNLLNDTGFSSSSSSRTVVPKSGVTVFVTFIPHRPFDAGWWTQACAQNTYLGSINKTRVTPDDTDQSSVGLDVDRALEVCTDKRTDEDNKAIADSQDSSGTATGDDQIQPIPPKTRTVGSDIFANPTVTTFSKWSGTTLSLFRDLAHVAIAGTHVTDEQLLRTSLASLDCDPLDSSGDVLLNGKAAITCKLKGANLGTVAKVRLRSSADPSQTVDSSFVMTPGDPTSGTASFDQKSLTAGATYSVSIIDKTDIESGTSTGDLKVADAATVTGINPSTLDPTKMASPQPVAMEGTNLRDVSSVILTSADGTVHDEFTPTSATDTTLQIQLSSTSPVATVDTSKSSVSFNISLISQTKSVAATEKVTLTISEGVPPKKAGQ
ncbi:MAG: hypothetical protein KGK08_13635 [Acidobacteriota bacterium]|nr:hypothetical protein [Acidobacteriota bacterium]